MYAYKIYACKKSVSTLFCQIEVYVIFLIIHENFPAIFCAPKIGFRFQKQPVLLLDKHSYI